MYMAANRWIGNNQLLYSGEKRYSIRDHCRYIAGIGSERTHIHEVSSFKPQLSAVHDLYDTVRNQNVKLQFAVRLLNETRYIHGKYVAYELFHSLFELHKKRICFAFMQRKTYYELDEELSMLCIISCMLFKQGFL